MDALSHVAPVEDGMRPYDEVLPRTDAENLGRYEEERSPHAETQDERVAREEAASGAEPILSILPLVAELLSPRQRDVVRSLLGGTTQARAALLMGIERQTVNVHLGRALDRLRKLLSKVRHTAAHIATGAKDYDKPGRVILLAAPTFSYRQAEILSHTIAWQWTSWSHAGRILGIKHAPALIHYRRALSDINAKAHDPQSHADASLLDLLQYQLPEYHEQREKWQGAPVRDLVIAGAAAFYHRLRATDGARYRSDGEKPKPITLKALEAWKPAWEASDLDQWLGLKPTP
jgi:hypothetical protein